MLHFLPKPSEQQYRLGWLRVIARFVGDETRSVQDIAAHLLAQMPRTAEWMRAAGLPHPPLGTMSPTRVRRGARMGINYRIYNEDTQRLTDLGHVLREADDATQSPFLWQSGMRWLGLYAYMQAAGDVLIPVLHALAQPTHTFPQTRLIRDVLRALEQSAPPPQRAELKRQLDQFNTSQSRNPARAQKALRDRFLLAYLEPVRELGYMQLSERSYHLTALGERLAAAFTEGTLADEVLDNNLAQLWWSAEGEEATPLDNIEPLLLTMQRLPQSLRASQEEAPLAPLTLLTQCHLISTQIHSWTGTAPAHQLLRSAEREGHPSLSIKSGLLHGEVHVVWSAEELPAQLAPEPPPPHHVKPFSQWALPARHRQWLQLCWALLQDEGDCRYLHWTGPQGSLVKLQQLQGLPERLLRSKRAPSRVHNATLKHRKTPLVPADSLPPALVPLELFRAAIQGLPAARLLDALSREWPTREGKNDNRCLKTPGLTALLRRAMRAAQRLPAQLLQRVREWLSASDGAASEGWPAIQAATAALIFDAHRLGLWELSSLRETMLQCMREHEARGAVEQTALTFAEKLIEAAPEWTHTIAFPISSFQKMTLPVLQELTERGTMSGKVSLTTAFLTCEGKPVTLDEIQDAGSSSDTISDFTVSLRACGPARSAGQARRTANQLTQRLLDELGENIQVAEGTVTHTAEQSLPLPDKARKRLTDGLHYLSASPKPRPARVAALLDDQAPLTRTQQSLRLARARPPTERLLIAWSAVEHLFVDDGVEKAGPMIQRLAAATTLHRLRTQFTSALNEALHALLLQLMSTPHPAPALREAMSTWVERDAQETVEKWLRSPLQVRPTNLAVILPSHTPTRALTTLYQNASCCTSLVQSIEEIAPLCARRIERWSQHMRHCVSLTQHAVRVHAETRSLLWHIYEQRNRSVHEGRMVALHEQHVPAHLHRIFTTMVSPVLDQLPENHLLYWEDALQQYWDLCDLPGTSGEIKAEKNSPPPSLEVLLDIFQHPSREAALL